MMRERIKALWRLCFNDTEEFIDMYFRLRYSNDINVAIESGDEVISALQMLPYPMTFCGETVRTAYISGACTHPEFRGNGAMRQLLSQSFAQMLHNNIYFSTLIPAESWLFDYYAHLEYVPVFNYSIIPLAVPSSISSEETLVEQITEYQDEIYLYLNRYLQKRSCYVQHSKKDFKVILADLEMSKGMLFVAKQKNRIAGVAILYKQDNRLEIQELTAESQETVQALLYHIQHDTKCDQIDLVLPPTEEKEIIPLGMARIINAKAVLQLYAIAYPKDELQIELTDKHLAVNNGYYYLCSGKCLFSETRLPGTHLQMTIGELTERILTPLHPYMSLMLN